MLSNKWTFSLKILVVILVLALVAPSAMAGEFSVSLGVSSDTDVSFADGNQVEIDEDAATTTDIMVTFGAVVDSDAAAIGAPTVTVAADQAASGTDFGADDIQIIAYNKFGGTVTDVTFGTPYVTPADPADGLNFMLSLVRASDSDAVRVLLFMAKHGVEKADPRAELDDAGARTADGKSAEASIELHYVAEEADAGAPTVISISKVGASLLPVTPVTAATFDVLVTLSEMPRKDGFKKDHIDASNATAADPVAIESMRDSHSLRRYYR